MYNASYSLEVKGCSCSKPKHFCFSTTAWKLNRRRLQAKTDFWYIFGIVIFYDSAADVHMDLNAKWKRGNSFDTRENLSDGLWLMPDGSHCIWTDAGHLNLVSWVIYSTAHVTEMFWLYNQPRICYTSYVSFFHLASVVHIKGWGIKCHAPSETGELLPSDTHRDA